MNKTVVCTECNREINIHHAVVICGRDILEKVCSDLLHVTCAAKIVENDKYYRIVKPKNPQEMVS